MHTPKFILAAVAATVAFGAQAQEAKTNPFTGKGQTIEALMMDLERAKIVSAIANESLATSKAKAEEKRLGTADFRSISNEPAPGNSAPPSMPRARPAKPVASVELPVPSPVPAPPLQASPPRLIGTAETATGWVAMVYVPALKRVINLVEGVTVDGFTARGIRVGAATVNGHEMRLPSVTARLSPSEQPAAAPPKMAAVTQPELPSAATPSTPPIDLPMTR